MVLSGAMQWWEEWQLRILVLGSLFIQFILYFSDTVRRSPSLRKFRVLVWIAYVGGDAIAIYALATLFNRHNQQTADGGSTVLEVVWAPVLLIHLGGQPWITAYSLEDNELWKRHVITVVCQVTVALYVFSKWWSGEKLVLHAAVLLFIVGILKFAQKPWTLKRASINYMLASATETTEDEGFVGACCLCCTTTCSIRHIGENLSGILLRGREGRSASTLKEYVEEVKLCLQGRDSGVFPKMDVLGYIFQMFVDLSATYTCRLRLSQLFLDRSDGRAYVVLQQEIKYVFQLLYTKLGTTSSLAGVLPLLLLPVLLLLSIVLFAVSKKDGYDENDIRVTYILLCCTALEELLLIISFFWAASRGKYIMGNSGEWHGMVSQNNIMSLCGRRKQPTLLLKLATFKFLREHLNEHAYIWEEPAAYRITCLVRQHVTDGWKKYIRGSTARYRRFHDFRGQYALRSKQELVWSLDRPFSESIVLWHIATDLCFHYPNPDASPGAGGDDAERSREISNYMVYLLSTHPEMIMPGTAPNLVTIAAHCIEEVLENSKEPQRNMVFSPQANIAREIINSVKLSAYEENDLIHNACILAEALMGLCEGEKWSVIQGVWVEMLCYSASRCRGYLHAQSLGEGGEYLTTVWLHWSCMGMETLADRLQRPEPPLDGEEERKEEQQQRKEEAEDRKNEEEEKRKEQAEEYRLWVESFWRFHMLEVIEEEEDDVQEQHVAQRKRVHIQSEEISPV